MKMRISMLTTVLILITMLPITAFAKSEYRIDRTPTVADDAKFYDTPDGYRLDMVPRLTITAKDIVTNGQSFRLVLENAQWDDEDGNLINIDTGLVENKGVSSYTATFKSGTNDE